MSFEFYFRVDTLNQYLTPRGIEGQFARGPPKFVDPRTVAEYPSSIRVGPSALSSPTNIAYDPQSRSNSPASSKTYSPVAQFLAQPPIFDNTQKFEYPSVAAIPRSFNSRRSSYEDTGELLDNDLTYQSGSKSCPSGATGNSELTTVPSLPLRKRGPGRPSKAQSAAQFPNSKRPTGHSAVKIRRQMHNDSAMRSRARLNNMLEELWNAIPTQERILYPDMMGGDLDNTREVCRAAKVEVAIHYMKKLQSQLAHSRM